MKNNYVIGIDIGNSDVKTANNSFPTGYVETFSKPPLSDEKDYIEYNGNFYVLSESRFPYTRDKSNDDKMFILSIIAIAKELNGKVKELPSVPVNVTLAIGLPPMHMQSLRDKYVNYYKLHFGDGVAITYLGKNLTLLLSDVEVYPQNLAAITVWKDKKADSIAKKFRRFCAIDIGGYTVDKIFVDNGKPQIDKCFSKELGVLRMYESIVAFVDSEFGLFLDNNDIEDVLRNRETVIPENVRTQIKRQAHLWIKKIFNEIAQSGTTLAATPTIFLGGASMMLKSNINTLAKENNMTIEFIPGTRANASAYQIITIARNKQQGR